MHFQIGQFFFILFCHQERFHVVKGTRPLTAVNNSSHANKLFKNLRNDESPTNEDPAFEDRLTRKRICQEITNSGFFEQQNLQPVVMNEVLDELKKEYKDIFSRIYEQRKTKNILKRAKRPFKYGNPFTAVQFKVHTVKHGHEVVADVTEYVFVCVLRHARSKKLVPRYVTKEYNVFGDSYTFGDQYKAGRFVLEKEEIVNEEYTITFFVSICLAEEPSTVDEKLMDSDVELELFYLQTRKYREPAEDDEVDPLCRHTGGGYGKSQQFRFCVAILRSPYFADKYAYPYKIHHRDDGCIASEVSFRTPEAREMSLSYGGTYVERMAKCTSVSVHDGHAYTFYFSRAYIPMRLFVYQLLSDGKIYLKSLVNEVAVVDMPSHPFEDVED